MACFDVFPTNNFVFLYKKIDMIALCLNRHNSMPVYTIKIILSYLPIKISSRTYIDCNNELRPKHRHRKPIQTV